MRNPNLLPYLVRCAAGGTCCLSDDPLLVWKMSGSVEGFGCISWWGFSPAVDLAAMAAHPGEGTCEGRVCSSLSLEVYIIPNIKYLLVHVYRVHKYSSGGRWRPQTCAQDLGTHYQTSEREHVQMSTCMQYACVGNLSFHMHVGTIRLLR